MRRPVPCFLALESYWSEDLASRESVQPFVKGLCDLYQWEFHYRTFDSGNDIKLWVDNFNRIRRSGRHKVVYIASHGSSRVLATLEEKIPTKVLVSALKAAPSIVGLHLGACSLGQEPLLNGIMRKTSLQWVAAYDREVPWMESSILDLLFWSWIYGGVPRPKRTRRLTPEQAAHQLYERFNFSREMGFRVVFRDPKEGIVSSWKTWGGKPAA
jgi:hypothetical protein